LASLFGSWNWKLPDSASRLLRVPVSVVHAEKPEVAVGD
jgi:putative drug exporter of the RND superfamily